MNCYYVAILWFVGEGKYGNPSAYCDEFTSAMSNLHMNCSLWIVNMIVNSVLKWLSVDACTVLCGVRYVYKIASTWLGVTKFQWSYMLPGIFQNKSVLRKAK